MRYEILLDPDPPNPLDRYEPGDAPYLALFTKQGPHYLGSKNLNFTADQFNSWKEMEDHIMANYNIAYCLPVFCIHTRFGFSTTVIKTPEFKGFFNSEQLGFAFITREQCEGIESDELQQYCKHRIDSLLALLAGYINGGCYRYVIYDSEGSVIGSCGGFYEYALCKIEAEKVCGRRDETS